MRSLPLRQLPNQSFTIMLDGNSWEFLLKTVGDTTVVGVQLNGATVLESARAVAGGFIIPAKYEEAGNFFFVTQNFLLPYYTQFSITQALIYISAVELAALRVPPPLPITAANFNPIAALPLRFAPVGYVEA